MTSLTPFPCSLERTAASALLLLSAQPPSLSPPLSREDVAVDPIKEGSADSGSTLSLESTDAKSSSSSKTSDVSPEDFGAHQLRIIAVAARFHEFKLQVARRARSKIIKSSDDWKSSTCKTVSTSSSEFESTKAASSITSSSGEGSSAQNLGVQKFKKKREEAYWEVLSRKRPGSTHMRRRADAILTFLSEGCASEVKIRHVLGDSPDTSKALRMLLKLDEVKRSGTGGRHDPYIYEGLFQCLDKKLRNVHSAKETVEKCNAMLDNHSFTVSRRLTSSS